MKTNIYVFWIGDTSNLKHLKFNKSKYNVQFGPTVDEHKVLYKESKYYRESYDMKEWSFCSDVWRAFKLSKEKGLYIDVSVFVGKDFDKFVEKLEKYETALFRGNFKWIESGILWSGIDKNPFFKKCYDFYKRDDLSPLYTFIYPAFISKFAYEDLRFTFGWKSQTKGNNYLGTLLEIRDEQTIKKVSAGSWGNKKTINYQERMKQDRWNQWEDKFRNKKESKLFSKKVDRVLKGNAIDVEMIRTSYFNRDKKYIHELKTAYKQVNYRKSIDELIIWPKLARIFKK